MRNKDEIVEAEQEHFDRAWFVVHTTPRQVPDTSREAREGDWHAEELRRKYPDIAAAGELDAFEAGVVFGKLEALRWVLGDDWGNRDT